MYFQVSPDRKRTILLFDSVDDPNYVAFRDENVIDYKPSRLLFQTVAQYDAVQFDLTKKSVSWSRDRVILALDKSKDHVTHVHGLVNDKNHEDEGYGSGSAASDHRACRT